MTFTLVIVMLSAPIARAESGPRDSPKHPNETATLRFVASSERTASVSIDALRGACPVREVAVEDPYHKRLMTYFGFELGCALDLGFASSGGREFIRGKNLLLRALDGYTRPAPGELLLESGGVLAFGEVVPGGSPDGWAPRFSPIDRVGANPGPFYMVWTGSGQNDPHAHPWPYQLATFEVAAFSEAFPRTVPRGLAADAKGWRGYALFEANCASCHSINGEGGKVGPELNIPRSIVEYRPVEQIMAYIRNPEATRYTNMPAHPGLSDQDLSELIAYFRAMSERKQDPRRSGG